MLRRLQNSAAGPLPGMATKGKKHKKNHRMGKSRNQDTRFVPFVLFVVSVVSCAYRGECWSLQHIILAASMSFPIAIFAKGSASSSFPRRKRLAVYPVYPVHRCSIYSPSRLIFPVTSLGCTQPPRFQGMPCSCMEGGVRRLTSRQPDAHPSGGRRTECRS